MPSPKRDTLSPDAPTRLLAILTHGSLASARLASSAYSEPMATLILLRHGRSVANTNGILAGRAPGVGLDVGGKTQAQAVGERLHGVPLAAAVHSPLQRCQETLNLALSAAGLAPQHTAADDRFTECDYGLWTGRLLSELVNEPLWQTIQQTPSQVTFPEGESMTSMLSRVCAGVAEWNERVGAHGIWLLAGHADPIKAILSDALGQPFDQFQRIHVDPASISVVHYPPQGAPMVLTTNTKAGQVTDILGSLVATGSAIPEPGGGAGLDAPSA